MKVIPNTSDRYRRYAQILTQAGWTCHEPGQSCVGVSHSVNGKRATSKLAASRVLPKTGTQRRAVYDYLARNGPATDLELQQQIPMIPDSERPRRGELVDGGLVEDSGARRKHHGEECIVWRLVDHA